MGKSDRCRSHDARWNVAHGNGVVAGWLACVLGVAAGVGASSKARSRARGGVHRVRVVCGLAPLACGALLMLAASLPEALAATSRATGVKASPLELVSCVSAGNCTAVGDGSSGHKPVLLLTETSGKWAAGVEARLPADVGKRQFFQLLSMSCASAGNCTAVGDYTAGPSHEQGLLLTETSGRWATAVEAPLPANAATPLQTGDASDAGRLR